MTRPPSPSLSYLLKFTLPLCGAMVSQALINIVDTALVGHLGGLALASIAIGSYMVFVLVAVPVGLSTGIQVCLSQYRSKDATAYLYCLLASVLVMLAVTSVLVVLGYYTSPWLIKHFVLDDRMSGLAQDYFDWRLWCLPGIGLSLLCRCFWVSEHQPWHYTKLIIITHVANGLLSYGLIYGSGPLPALGAVGAGIGTFISIYLGLTLQLIHLARWQYQQPVSTYPMLWRQLTTLQANSGCRYLGRLLCSALPGAINQVAFALYMAVLLWLISHLGASALASSFAVLNVGLVIILPYVGLGQAISGLIQVRDQPSFDQDKQWIRLAIGTGFIQGLLILVLVTWLSDYLFSWLFINPHLAHLAAMAMPVYGLALLWESISQVLTRVLIAYGHALQAALINSLCHWLLIIPFTAGWVLFAEGDLQAIWWIQLVGKLCLALCLVWVWLRSA